MIEEDDEFEDALDAIDTAKMEVDGNELCVHLPVHNANLAGSINRPVASRQNCFPLQSNLGTPNFTSPLSLGVNTPLDSSVSRRDRLTALRHRMREEFGAREAISTIPTSDGDTLSVISDATSLHSWHRRVLAGSDTVIVHPSDSISTRAVSVTVTPSLWSPHGSSEGSRIESVPEDKVLLNTVQSSRSPHPIPVCSYNKMSPTGPPPTHPPPPLPFRDRGYSNPWDPRSPPPLPPRNPSVRLPDPVAAELVSRLSRIDDESSFHTPIAGTSTDNVVPNLLISRSQRVSTNSTDSIPSVSGETGSGRRRGHTKTNSLDRGLTLAKSLKAGPFPPPANKSNSLTRQEADGGEECERNTAAEGVIRQITTELIGEHQNVDNQQLESIASESSSISSPSSEHSKKKSKQVITEKGEVREKLVADKKELQENGCNSVITKETTVKCFSNETSPDFCMPSSSLCSPIDPITRDVERRMSMKRDGNLTSDRTSEDGRSDRFSNTRSSIGHAKSLARNYSSFASGLFKGAFQKVMSAAHGSGSTPKTVEDDTSESEGEQSETGATCAGQPGSIVRPRKAKKGPFDFEHLRVMQELNNEHTGAVWCVRFSVCGRLMATAGQDSIIRVWTARSHTKYFTEMRERYQQKTDGCSSASDVFESTMSNMESFRPPSSSESNTNSESVYDDNDVACLVSTKPFAVFKGHTADILDLSWSKNYFILSSGMDRTVKLWHLSRSECLCCFQHVDFVTCVAFLPKDDRYFLSGSLDGKLRLWHIPDKKVAVWNEVQVKFITAITFVKNGKFAVVGTYNGRCYFYTTDQLKYHTVVDVRSSRGKNARGHKVTGLAVHGDKLLVTSNDSRIRMYDVRDKALTCKFRGAQNEHSQIRADFSHDGKHIVCGSEDKFVYLWRTSDLPSTMSVRKDRNAMWERVRTHTAPVSVAVFGPKPQVFLSMLEKRDGEVCERAAGQPIGHVIVSADLQGSIKIMVNRPKLTKTGQSTFFAQE